MMAHVASLHVSHMFLVFETFKEWLLLQIQIQTPTTTPNKMQGFPPACIRRPACTDPSDLACTRPSALMEPLLYHWLVSNDIPRCLSGFTIKIAFCSQLHRVMSGFT
ncbi:hypothetical protein FPOAC2_01613 [Fusarium poae]